MCVISMHFESCTGDFNAQIMWWLGRRGKIFAMHFCLKSVNAHQFRLLMFLFVFHVFSESEAVDGDGAQEIEPKSNQLVTDARTADSAGGSQRSVCLFNTSNLAKLIILCVFIALERVFNLTQVFINSTLNPDNFQSKNMFNLAYMAKMAFMVKT